MELGGGMATEEAALKKSHTDSTSVIQAWLQDN